eukprot:m.254102 g.254102  ORF g.254102 m.254102 type:complete len:296 (-) comp18777_c0_seq1:151-1038(-)
MAKKGPPARKHGGSHSSVLLALGAVALAVIALMAWPSGSSVPTVSAREAVVQNWTVPCSSKKEFQKSCGKSTCSRHVWDGLVPEEALDALVALATGGMALGGAAGGPTILDLHSGALSKGSQFIDVFREAASHNLTIFTDEALTTYRAVKEIIRDVLEDTFEVPLHLTKPTFFSSITNKKAITPHDEYWHTHIDKVTYGSFDVTCLLYLTTHAVNFTGGEFSFSDEAGHPHMTVEPRRGRLSCFTSGSENIHFVHKVTSGRRLALTIAFTCNRAAGIPDPSAHHAVVEAARPDGM